MDDKPNNSYGDQRTDIPHQTHVMSLRRTKEDPIFRMERDLVEHDCGSFRILYECQLEAALLLKGLGVSSGILGDSEPLASFQRSRIITKRLFHNVYKFYERVRSRG
jgi:hypothetical protein